MPPLEWTVRRRKFDLLFCVPRARPENAPRINPFYPQNPRVKAFYYRFLRIFAKHEKKTINILKIYRAVATLSSIITLLTIRIYVYSMEEGVRTAVRVLQ